MQTQIAIAPTALAPADDALVDRILPPATIALGLGLTAAWALRHRIWPQAMIALGLGLTVAWTGLLVYGLAKLVERAF
jgi:hypothetical protein